MTTATTEQLPPAPDEARHFVGLRFMVAFVAGLVLAAAVAIGGVYAFEQQYNGRILPGVRVGGVDLSGLTPGQAKAQLSQAYASLEEGRIVVVGPDDEQAIAYTEIGRRPDVEAIVADALVAGRGGTPIERVVAEARTALRGVGLAPRITFDGSLVAERLAALTRPLDRDPVDATVVRTPSGFATTPAGEGRRLDDSAARETILATLARLDAPAEVRVELAVQPVEPAVNDAGAALAKARAERMVQDVVLGVDDERWTIPRDTVRTWVGFAVTPDGRYEPTVDRAAIRVAVEPFASKIDRPPKDASFLIGKGDQVVGVRPGA